MASSDSVLSISSVLECSICMEEFNEDNLPRTLPCSHVYCTTCLTQLARNPRGMITCPSCRKEHNVAVEDLIISRPVIDLQDIKHTKQMKNEAQRQEQRSDRSDSASTVRGQAQSASQTSDTDIQGLYTSLDASMYKLSQSGKILEKNINETNEIQETLEEKLETLQETVNARMEKVIETASKQRQQINERLGGVFKKNLSQLKDTKKKLKARQEDLERFRSNMDEKAAALQGDAPADHEKIKKLIEEIKESNYNSPDKISITLEEVSLDTDDVKYQSILTDVSSWGGIKTEYITREVPPAKPQNQSNLEARTHHYLAKTKVQHISNQTQNSCIAQLPNDDIAVGYIRSPDVSVYNPDFKPRRVISLSGIKSDGKKLISGIYGMCATPDGNLCISNPNMKTVHVVTPEGRLESSFKTCPPPLKEDFNPWGLASNKEGEVFVCDRANHVIRVFDQGGQECRRFGGLGEEPGKLRRPWDVAVTPDGKVAVADTENHRIQVFDGATGRYLATLGSKGREPNQFDWPTGIAIDSMGFVAVAEQGNRRVQVFTPSWEFLRIIKKKAHPFSIPRGILFTKRNEIVVCEDDTNWLFIF